MNFRFILQPIVATIIAIRAGRQDAKEQRPVFFWTLLRGSSARREMLQQLWLDIGKLFLVAVLLDVIYQVMVFHCVYPVETLTIAAVLAIVPYLVVRGMTNRILSKVWKGLSNATEKDPHRPNR